jgi:maleamate amidohydrolase
MSQGLQRLLEQTFQRDSAAYAQRGFQRRVGYGNRRAVVHIDLANAWTRPGHPFSWT